MNIRIQSIHFDADSKLIEYINQKLEKLGQFSDKIIDAAVYLKLNNHHDKNNKHVEIKIHIHHSTLFKGAESSTFEAATELVIEALKVQIKKRKEMLLQNS